MGLGGAFDRGFRAFSNRQPWFKVRGSGFRVWGLGVSGIRVGCGAWRFLDLWGALDSGSFNATPWSALNGPFQALPTAPPSPEP